MEQIKKKSVCVIGLGYIGLPTAALLASRGYRVHGVDISQKVVDTINRGEIHIVEPDLDTFVRAAVDSGRLTASTKPTEADVYMICVPTPFHESTEPSVPAPDMSYVNSAAESLVPFLRTGNMVILESTSPVGTTESLEKILRKGGVKTEDLAIAYCPERVLPGKIMHELVNNDRIVGGLNDTSSQRVRDFYQDFVSGEVIMTDAKTAEMTKLTENSFRDVNIAFANELSLLCDQFGINVWELIRLANRHPRVKILQPGPGVGGHCISVDPWFLVHQAPEKARLIHTARTVNDSKPRFVLEKIDQALSGNSSASICFLGLSFKANIDDLRESPAVQIVETFTKTHQIEVFAVEPNVEDLPRDLRELGVQKTNLKDGIQKAQLIVLLVDHDEFKLVDRAWLKGKKIVDTRGIWQ